MAGVKEYFTGIISDENIYLLKVKHIFRTGKTGLFPASFVEKI